MDAFWLEPSSIPGWHWQPLWEGFLGGEEARCYLSILGPQYSYLDKWFELVFSNVLLL